MYALRYKNKPILVILFLIKNENAWRLLRGLKTKKTPVDKPFLLWHIDDCMRYLGGFDKTLSTLANAFTYGFGAFGARTARIYKKIEKIFINPLDLSPKLLYNK